MRILLNLFVVAALLIPVAPASLDVDASKLPAMKADNVASMQVVGGLPGTKHSPLFVGSEQAGAEVIDQLVGWINAAQIIDVQPDYGRHGYPMVVRIRLKDGGEITLEPAYECTTTTKADRSVKTCHAIKGEVALWDDTGGTRIAAPPLFDWLQSLQGGWK